MRHRLRLQALIMLATLSLLTSSVFTQIPAAHAAGSTYYVDCVLGSDSNTGATETSAWKTLGKANSATLYPGSTLLLKRGCAWTGFLQARWNGTASAPILISAYGTGALPKIVDSSNSNVKITGSYQILEYLHADRTATSYDYLDATCNNQPIGWRVGFNFQQSAHHNVLRNSQASHHSAGISFSDASHDNQVLTNVISENFGLWLLERGNPVGGTGVNLHGDRNEIGWNTFRDNKSICAFDDTGAVDSNKASISIELYHARYSNVHHNIAYGDRVFSELGSSPTFQSTDNRFAYNVHYTSKPSGRFIVTRGAGASFGPVWQTMLYNNTTYYTGADSQAIACTKCAPSVVTMRNNILVAAAKAIYVGPGESLTESNNILWPTNGSTIPTHFVQNMSIASTTRIIDPQLIDPGAMDFHLNTMSPAIDMGTSASVTAGYIVEMDHESVPLGGLVDIGADETVATSGIASPPIVSAPLVSLPTVKAKTGAISATVTWAATDDDGIAIYELQHSIDGGPFTSLGTILSTEATASLSLTIDTGSHQFRARATDILGDASDWATGPVVELVAAQENKAAIKYTGTWSTEVTPGSLGNSVTHSASVGDVAKMAFAGTGVSWITSRGPDQGRADIWLDGVKVKAVDLYAAATQPRMEMFAIDGLSNGTHLLEIRVSQWKNAQSTGRLVAIDAFIFLRPLAAN